MKKFLLVTHWLILANAAPVDRASPPLPNINTPVRVLLERGSRLALVQSPKEKIYLKHGNNLGWRVLGKNVSITISEKFPVPRLALNGVPLSSSHIYLRGGTQIADSLTYNGNKFRGALRITLEDTKLAVTNVLPLEEYLVGMLASEMNAHWELESLKAQAVASRGYALYMMMHPKHRLFDLEKSIQDQVYRGVDSETPRVRMAVNATAGEYLAKSNEDNDPVKAFYHSRCGGTTETSDSVWNDASSIYLRRPCHFCRQKPFTWKTSLKLKDLSRLLGLEYSPNLKIESLSRTPSGRVNRLSVASGGKKKTLSSDELRSLLGYTRIKSAYFAWQLENNSVIFEGKGAGHGVGMCQWGARHLSQQGKTYREILAHFYPGLPVKHLAIAHRQKMLD